MRVRAIGLIHIPRMTIEESTDTARNFGIDTSDLHLDKIPAHRTVYARVRGREQVPCGCVAKPAVLRYFPARMSYALCRRCANCVEGCDCANLQSEISRRSCMPKPLLEDVFKRSGLPTYTFVEPAEYNHLKIALRTPGRGVQMRATGTN